MQPPPPRRACLVVPASSGRKLLKAQALAVDEVVIDLEDALVPEQKNAATRATVASALREAWRAPIRAVRVNALGTQWFHEDVRDVVSLAGRALTAIVLPKVESAADVQHLDDLLTQLEPPGHRVAIEAQIESARGLLRVEEIAAASSRLEALVFGPADFASSLGIPTLGIGTMADDYPGDQWAYPRSRIAVAAHANGLAPIDGPYGAYQDLEGLHETARRARILGFAGKWAIHPEQIAGCRRVFSPSPEEVAAARRILGALDAAARHGDGATSSEGSMLDEASRRLAESVLGHADADQTAGS
jgi:citrate lyase subunit beta/citryl-CoA lyase